MKILILSVTYRSYDMLQPFVSAVETAVVCCPEADVTVAIGDNTDSDWEPISIHTDKVNLRLFDYHQNLGYLGCAFKMLNELRTENNNYDFVAISNVDLTISPDFFQNLLGIDVENVGWLAPDVYTPSRKSHANPFIMKRPAAKDFLKWKLMYSNPILYGFIETLSGLKQKDNSVCTTQVEMYAGHGSFMLFTNAFINKYEKMEFPAFMYTEEIFFGELVRNAGLKVRFEPSLHITNVGSVSVSLLGTRWKCKQSRESLDAVYEKFFKNN